MLRTEINKWKHKFVVLKKVYLSIISTINGFELKKQNKLPNNQNCGGTRQKLDSMNQTCSKILTQKKYLVKFQNLDRLSISK